VTFTFQVTLDVWGTWPTTHEIRDTPDSVVNFGASFGTLKLDCHVVNESYSLQLQQGSLTDAFNFYFPILEELDGRASTLGRGKRLFTTPQRPDLLWGPPSLI
jgi:hypothetical protein